MLPNNYVVGGQPGLPQSQPQSGPQQGMPNMGTMDQRMWMQQQQQQQQLAQLRAQQQGNGGQLTPQMLDFMRTRNLQGNSQAMAQQRQFGGGMPPMGVNNSPFPHDPSQGMQNPQQQFGNPPGGQNFPNPLHLQGLQRSQGQMFPNQGATMRQLDLMMAQNQQNQNGVPNQNSMAAALQRQLAQQQQSQVQQPQPSQMPSMGAPQLPPGLFGNITMQPNLQNIQQHSPMGPSRTPGVMVSRMPEGQMQGQQHARRAITLAEMQVKAAEFNSAIAAGESRIKNLQDQAMTNHLPPEAVAQEINKVQKDVRERRQALNKIMTILRGGNVNGAALGTFPNGMDMKVLAGSPVPPQRIAGAPQNSQMGWMQNPSQNQFNSPRPMSSQSAHLAPNPTPQPQAPQMSTPQLPQMVATQPNAPQRATPLPVPPPGGAQPSQGGRPNSLVNFTPLTLQYGPLNRDSFTKAYFQQWIPKHPVDQSILQLENRNIDLYMLHSEIMGMNGYKCAIQQAGPNQPAQILCNLTIPSDQWPIIAARLGFVHFPANGAEPAKSGPGVAVHLECVYRQCLQEFDSQYLRQLIHHRRMMILGQSKVNGAEGASGVPGMSPQGLSDIKDPKAINEIINYANLSVQELQARGVQPHIIALVEKHRDQLKSTLETQRTFAQGIQNATPQGQPRNVSNPVMGNVNPMLHAQNMNMANAMNGVAKPSMQPGQPPQPMSMPPTSTMAQNGQPLQRPGVGGALIPIAAASRPTQAQTKAAVELVMRLREENKHVGFPNNRPLHMPDAQRLEYNAQFEHLHRLVSALDHKLPHFAVCMKEEVIKKLVVMIHVVQQQREALASNPSQYYMPLQWVKAMIIQATQTNQVFHQWVNNAMRASQAAEASQPHASTSGPTQPGPSNPQIRPPAPPVARPPTAQSVPASALSPAGPHVHTPVASGASPQALSTPSLSKKQTPKPSGDVASASTPSHASPPQTPKSPKNKPKPKPQSKARKPSKVLPVPGASSPAETKPPTTPAAAATPASAPTPEPMAGSKRQREEEPIASTSTSTPPSAKKIKTEWDDTSSDTLLKRQAEADGAKTDEDTVKFLEQMSSWLTQMGGEGDGQDSLKTEIAESLDEILRAYPVAADDGMSLAASSFIDSINVGSSSPRQTALDPAEFFDFTLYGLPEEDAGSKADTPDLVQASSSVGPSPGSASETEHPPASASTGADTAKIVDPKNEPPSGGDSMSQDLWRAIDGGESAFYNSSDNWKWDQPMQPLEQPWAIYSSS